MKDINQREIAVNALIEITTNGGYNNIVLRKTLNKNMDLDAINRAFITELVNGSLRNLIYIDYVIDYFSKTHTKAMKPLILNVLRIGVYQILFLDKTPDSAACNEAVKITKKKFSSLSGFVNGVLRNIVRNKNDIKLPDREKDVVNYLSICYSCPTWIIDYWLKEMDTDHIENMLKNSNKPPDVTICVNTLKSDREELKSKLEDTGVICKNGLLDNALHIKNLSDFTSKQPFKDGLYHVMDESSMLAVKIMDPKPEMTIMDVCAAPGGKSFYLAYLMENMGEIFSYDIHEHKIGLMVENSNRLGILNMNMKINDATIFQKEFKNTADALILDVPCSGLGLIRKKADIKYTKNMNEIKELAKLQRKIFEACWRYVKPGGTLIYSTCTISKLENMDNINYFIKEFPFELVGFKSLITDELGCDTAKDGYIQILPNENNFDGFFIGKLRKLSGKE